jgi:hypothetical protein
MHGNYRHGWMKNKRKIVNETDFVDFFDKMQATDGISK